MGYYANSTEGTITIPADKLTKAYETLVQSYEQYNEKATWDKLPIPESLDEELTDAGFEFEVDAEGALVIESFDGKWRFFIERLIETLLSVATPDSAMAFRGEDGEMWRHTPSGTQNATIIWE